MFQQHLTIVLNLCLHLFKYFSCSTEVLRRIKAKKNTFLVVWIGSYMSQFESLYSIQTSNSGQKSLNIK